jgi:hypothetical protein
MALGGSTTGRSVALLLAVSIFSSACTSKLTRQLVEPESAATLDKKAAVLKAHMLDGQVYVLNDWNVTAERVSGDGQLFGVDRALEKTGLFEFPIDSVAIFETNRLHSYPPAVAALSVLTVASVGLAIYCAAAEKVCFGSCPTFYVEGDAPAELQAEGFSASVSPVLEATDLDALYRADLSGDELRLRMTNEALETHVVRHVDVLAASRPEDGRTFATRSGELWQATQLIEASSCAAEEGDCRADIAAFDGVERYSLADSADLSAREYVELEFPGMPAGEIGIVIAARQTLMSTYLFYQGLAFMGTSAGHWLAALERGGSALKARAGGIGQVLGRVEVMVEDGSGDWVVAGDVGETGPLVTDVQLVRIGRLNGEPLSIRLRLTRGLWRLDWIAAAALDGPAAAQRLSPKLVLRDGVQDDEVLKRVVDRDAKLVTLPGDVYTFVYALPADGAELELFVETRGYYLEWMREEWLADEDPARASLMFLDPQAALRALAPRFKQIEPRMEELFWSSRYVRQ